MSRSHPHPSPVRRLQRFGLAATVAFVVVLVASPARTENEPAAAANPTTIAPDPSLVAPSPPIDLSLQTLLDLESVFTSIAARIEPGVVAIQTFAHDPAWHAEESAAWEARRGWQETENDDLRWRDHRPVGHASGFLIDGDGYLLTTRSGLLDPGTGELAELVDVEIGSTFHEPARIVAVEPTLDLAVLRVVTQVDLHPLPLGNSGTLRPGQWALAFGDPEGPEKTLVVSHIAYEPHRDCYQDELSATFVQISDRVPAGAFGGPIVDLRGQVIAMSTAGATAVLSASGAAPTGAGAAASAAVSGTAPSTPAATPGPGSGYGLPINLATAIYKSLLFRASRESPWLGISVLSLTHEVRARQEEPLPQTGIYIDNVFAPSPAARAGVQVGDVLVRMGGHRILTPFDFQRWLYWTGPGGDVTLELVRDGVPITVPVILEVRPPEATTR